MKALSIPDISLLTLAYEIIKEQGNENLLRKQPTEYSFKDKNEKKGKFTEEEYINVDDEEEWIGLENIEEKLSLKIKTTDMDDENVKVYISTADYTIQNVSLKIGIPVMSIDGMKIRKIKNYILKCITCDTLNWDTSRVFCEHCGYNTMMKIGYSVDNHGNITIFDKKADSRLRGTKVLKVLNLV